MAKLAPLPGNSVVTSGACVGAEVAPMQPDDTRKEPVEQPSMAVLSPPGLTDGSMSEAPTPRADEEDDASVSTPLIGDEEEEEDMVKRSLRTAEEEAAVVPTPAAGPPQGQERRVAVTYERATQVLAELAREQAVAKASMDAKAAQVMEKRSNLTQLRKYRARLKAAVKEARFIAKERRRIQRVMEDRTGYTDDSSDDEDGRTSLEKDRVAIREEMKRLARQQDDYAVRFELLMSENRRMNLELQHEMAELRREYNNSYLFPGVQLG